MPVPLSSTVIFVEEKWSLRVDALASREFSISSLVMVKIDWTYCWAFNVWVWDGWMWCIMRIKDLWNGNRCWRENTPI